MLIAPPCRRYGLALTIVALSGCAALAHELLWTRRLIDLLGGSAESSARVFECFFLGLALGSACSTGLVRRVSRPWRAVGLIELAIAAACLPALALPTWTGRLWPWLGPDRLVSGYGHSVKLVMSIVVVVPPAFLMGLTLPVMAKAVLQGDRTLGRQGTWLYALNTFGGVVGLAGVTTWALYRFGVAGSMVVVMAVNVFLAGLCIFVIGDDTQNFGADGSTPPASEPRTPQAARSARRIPLSIGLVAFGSGAGILGIEVLCLHLFSQVAPTSIHSSAAVLTAVVLLLAAAAWLAPFLERCLGQADRLLVSVLAVSALATVIAPILFMRLTGNMATIQPAPSVALFFLKMAGFVLGSFGPALLVGGLVLPLTFSWFARDVDDPYARRWGWVLAINGVGGVVGAEAAQRLLMPIGMHLGIGVIALAYAALAVTIVISQERSAAFRGPFWRQVGVGVIVLAVGIGWLAKLRLIHPAPTRDIQFKTLWAKGGPEGFVAVTDSKEFGRGIIMYNQYMLGSTAALLDEQRQAHLPILVHPDPKKIAFIGLATGITAGAATMHPQVESITVVELSQLVTEACKAQFRPFTEGLMNDPRADIVVEDGRTYLASCTDRFDVVVGDLFLPWRTGVGRLYTLEHFTAVRRSLRQGGLFCQMLPIYQLNPDHLRVILATLQEVFPTVHLFRMSFNTDMPVLTLIAFKDADLDWAPLPARCDQLRGGGRVRDPLVRHLEGIAMLYLGKLAAGQRAGAGAINTLSNAWLELNAGRDFITGRWLSDGFLKDTAWLALEGQLIADDTPLSPLASDASNQPPKMPLADSVIFFSQLGRSICEWDLARRVEPDRAAQLRRRILPALPQALRREIAARSGEWAAWRDLIGPG